jgi:hypothetical protein
MRIYTDFLSLTALVPYRAKYFKFQIDLLHELTHIWLPNGKPEVLYMQIWLIYALTYTLLLKDERVVDINSSTHYAVRGF